MLYLFVRMCVCFTCTSLFLYHLYNIYTAYHNTFNSKQFFSGHRISTFTIELAIRYSTSYRSSQSKTFYSGCKQAYSHKHPHPRNQQSQRTTRSRSPPTSYSRRNTKQTFSLKLPHSWNQRSDPKSFTFTTVDARSYPTTR